MKKSVNWEERCKLKIKWTCTLFWWSSMAAHTRTAGGTGGCAHMSVIVQEGTSHIGVLRCPVNAFPNPSPTPPPSLLFTPPPYSHAPGLQGMVDAVQWPQLSAPSPGIRSIVAARKAWSSLGSMCPFISEEEGRGEEEGEDLEKERGMFATCPSFTWTASLALHISPCNVSDWLLLSTSPFLLQQTEGEEVERGRSMGADRSPDKPVNESHESSSSSGWSSCQPSCSCCSCSCAKVQKPFVTTPGRWSSRAPMWGWANCCHAWRVAEPGNESEKCYLNAKLDAFPLWLQGHFDRVGDNCGSRLLNAISETSNADFYTAILV